jgi:hypothetical protein
MTTGKEERASVHAAKPADNPICSLTNGCGRVAAGAAVLKKLPATPLPANLSRRLSFISAIVPFDKLTIHSGDRAETGQRASAQSPLQWTGEHMFKGKVLEPFAETMGISLASLRQRDIREAGVLARDGPGCFSVPDGGWSAIGDSLSRKPMRALTV